MDVLTQVLATVARPLGLMTPVCELALANKTLFTRPCLHDMIHRGLSLGILCGSSVLQLPQIIKIWSSKNAFGVSAVSYAINALAGIFFVLYNLLEGIAFLTWGETLFISLQYYILLMMCWTFTRERGAALKIVSVHVIYAGVIGVVLTGRLPATYRPILGLAPTPILVLGKLPQIVKNASQGHTGQLSVISTALTFAGNLVRIATTISLVENPVVLMSHILAAILNAVPLLQIFWYWGETRRALQKAAGKKSR